MSFLSKTLVSASIKFLYYAPARKIAITIEPESAAAETIGHTRLWRYSVRHGTSAKGQGQKSRITLQYA